ncbi:MAG: flagellar biosynthetic protein FliO [Candidatus Sericytochromatia bacterium]|nr:flagellar biosynthetic protein FliO [Candidatus Sericytochromatia bacterium]
MNSAEQLAQGQLTFGIVLEVMLKLGFVLLLIYFSFYLLRRAARQEGQGPLWQRLRGLSALPQADRIETLAIKPLGRQTTLYLLEVDTRRLLVAVQPQQPLQLLSEWPTDSVSTEAEPQT